MPKRKPQPKPQPAKIEQPTRRSLVGMRALSIRQPYAELILRGRKVIEYRSQPINIRERVLIYASKGRGDRLDEHAIAAEHRLKLSDFDSFPRGVLVGSIEIFDCREGGAGFEWRLRNPIRFAEPIAVPAGRQPTPVFWLPFPVPHSSK